MKKIVEKFKDLFKKVLSQYLFTYISIVLLTLIYVIFSSDSDFYKYSVSFLLTFSVLSFYIETKLKDKKLLLGYILTLVFSIIQMILMNSNMIDNMYYERFLTFYFISVPLITIYECYKKSKINFSKYMLESFSSLLKNLLVYLILLLGTFLISLLFDLLIVDVLLDNYDKILALITGLYFVPSFIYSLTERQEVGNFIKVLVSKVLFILVLLAYLIIYVYIFKILILQEIPSNIIFESLTFLFIVGTVVTIMNKESENNKSFIKINNLIPYLFIPFLILQIYALGIRITEYGITTTRYIGILILIFELVYIVLSITKKDYSHLLITLLIELVIGLLLPFINVIDLPIRYHYNVIKNNKGVYDSKVVSSYFYLVDYEEGEKLVNELLTKDEIRRLREYKPSYMDDYEYYYNYYGLEIIDVDDYKTLEYVYINQEDNEYDKNIIINNLNGYIDGSKIDNVIYYDDNTKILIETIDIKYRDNIEEYYINGVVLKK